MKTLLLIAMTTAGIMRAAMLATDGSQTDVQSKLDRAANGDVVTIPAGTFTWSGVRARTGVTIQGAGPDRTRIKSTAEPHDYGAARALWVEVGSSPTRVTQIRFDGCWLLGISGPKTGSTYRVDNCIFDGGTLQVVILEASGNGPGLIDHCTFSGGGASELIHNMGMGAGNKAGWADDVNPGTDQALYVENCTFSKNPLEDAYFWGTSGLQGYYGSRTVMRHCKLNAAHIDQHGTAGSVGARWFEFYDNVFHVPPPHDNYEGMAQSDYIALRGGSGVVFNNTVTGHNLWGNGVITIYDENGGSEPLYLGRGINQNPSPVYIWHNFQYDGTPMRAVASSDNVKENRDFFVSDSKPGTMKRWQKTSDNANTTFSYTPYQYPHPLNDGPIDTYAPGGEPGKPQPTPTPTPTPTPQPTPTPPQPTPTPTPPPTGSDYSNWLNRLGEWIRQNPATPNGR